jgi:hypothetical protein
MRAAQVSLDVLGTAGQNNQQDAHDYPQEMVVSCDGHSSVYGVQDRSSEGLPAPNECARPTYTRSTPPQRQGVRPVVNGRTTITGRAARNDRF